MSWQAVIGLECHVQLATRAKLFSPAGAAFGGAPNAHADPYTLALPGTLPVLNRAAIDLAIAMALATSCRVRPVSRFARKHYFYPDLPKGYQISQYDEPLAEGGRIRFLFESEVREVRLTRIHVEEDAGKSTHVGGAPYSLVDLNRAGVPLVEVVSEPDLRSAREAAEYLRAIRQLVRWLGVSDGNMEEGSLRCDANVSIRRDGDSALGTRTELKNINSFKHVQQAIDHEIARQVKLVEAGERIVQETRLYDADRGSTHPMRSKEDAHDYRYFPEPDLPPLAIAADRIDRIRAGLPELPLDRRARFMAALGLSPYDAGVLTAEKPIADYFERAVASGAQPKAAASFIGSELLGRLNREGASIERSKVAPEALGELLGLVAAGTIHGKIAKEVFDAMWTEGGSARAIVEERGLAQVTDQGAIEEACRAAVAAHPDQAEKFRGGAEKILGFFVGQVMKQTRGKANPELVNQILRKLLA